MASRKMILRAAARDWPVVLDEWETLRAVVAEGRSLARFGDGELKCAFGFGYREQEPNVDLAVELRELLRFPPEGLLPGIPTFDLKGPKIEFWHKYRPRFLVLLDRRVRYGSAFIGRPDHAPWVAHPRFSEELAKVWEGKRVVAICSKHNKTLRLKRAAREFLHVECPKAYAYSYVDELFEKAYRLHPDVVVLSCGVTATVLAGRFAANGIQALDVGSAIARALDPNGADYYPPLEGEEPDPEEVAG